MEGEVRDRARRVRWSTHILAVLLPAVELGETEYAEKAERGPLGETGTGDLTAIMASSEKQPIGTMPSEVF